MAKSGINKSLWEWSLWIYSITLLNSQKSYKQIQQREMGCASPQNANSPNIPPYHMNRLMQVANINHPLNINKKYEHVCTIDQSRETGHGFRKTYTWVALATKEQTSDKIKEYWESRTNGQAEAWRVIQQACATRDQNVALKMLSDNRISMLTGSIQMCVDSKLNKYEVPIFCINLPDSYSEQLIEDKNLNYEYEDKNMEIAIRTVKFPNGDIKLTDKASSQIQVVKQTLKAMKELPDTTRIRFFYAGREMKDDKTLGNYNYNPGTVIQAMIF